MWSKSFWKAAAERAIKTFAQSLIALLGIDKTNLIEINWVGALSAAGLATLISVLTSIASGAKDGNPSATNSEVASTKRVVDVGDSATVTVKQDAPAEVTVTEPARRGELEEPDEPDEDSFDVNAEPEHAA